VKYIGLPHRALHPHPHHESEGGLRVLPAHGAGKPGESRVARGPAVDVDSAHERAPTKEALSRFASPRRPRGCEGATGPEIELPRMYGRSSIAYSMAARSSRSSISTDSSHES
jgi:hypothetical protein